MLFRKIADIRKFFASIKAVDHRIEPFPQTRNLILDIVHEGLKKHTIHATFDADVTDFLEWRVQRRREGGEACSLTTFVTSCFARVVGEHPEIQAYRAGLGKKLVIFDDVDVLMVVEKELDGGKIPWFYTIRACNRKSAIELDRAISSKKDEGLHESRRSREIQWYTRQPVFVRRLLWLFPRHNPFVLKYFAGTVAVTSFGAYTKGQMAGLPITPMTLTLAIGSVDTKVEYRNGAAVERKIIKLTVSADHEIVDGAPGARLIRQLRKLIAAPENVLLV